MEHLNVVAECITSLHEEQNSQEGDQIQEQFSNFMKKKMKDLGSKMKPSMSTKMIQLLNLKTLFEVYQFSLFNVMNYVEKHVDQRIAMVLQLIYNSLGSSFESMSHLLTDTLSKRENPLSFSHPSSMTPKERMARDLEDLTSFPIESTQARRGQE